MRIRSISHEDGGGTPPIPQAGMLELTWQNCYNIGRCGVKMKITAETQRTRRGKGAGEQGSEKVRKWESEKGGKVHFDCLLCVLRASAVKSFTVTQLEPEVKDANLCDIRGFAAV
jgi:hypothetical protein